MDKSCRRAEPFDYKPHLDLIRQRWLQGVPSRAIAEELGPGAKMSTIRTIAQRMSFPMRDTANKHPDLIKEKQLDDPRTADTSGLVVNATGLVPINGRGHYADPRSATIILTALGRRDAHTDNSQRAFGGAP